MASVHTFHIPVLGLSYSIDTPLKVARFGISSVVSIIEDELIEKMRAYHALKNNEPYIPITTNDNDYRAERITAYLNLLHKLVDQQIAKMKEMSFDENNDLTKYFELLPADNELSLQYKFMQAIPEGNKKTTLQQQLKNSITPGAIDVNIMAKVDNLGVDKNGTPLPVEYSDALSALRGFANSELQSSVILSAGYNPRLYSYIEQFPDFYPNKEGIIKKQIILKVSDYRSAVIQGKIMAKKGLWISEYRIESGLNCGGHAFATDGILLGPILEEFRLKKTELITELLPLCNTANQTKGNYIFSTPPQLRITVQGGIGTSNEDQFLMNHYNIDGTGWGSPFLLVPEATNVDDHTLQDLATAQKDDYFLSNASPLGVPFNNFRKSTSEKQRITRTEKGRPGSPCYKKFLATDTEFSETPICTASRAYQHQKIKQLKEKGLPPEQLEKEICSITEKDCLCEGLSAAVFLKDGIPVSHKLNAVTICPGPNLAYFSGVFSLKEMIDHIYGRANILNTLPRPNMFINEAELYIDYLKNAIDKSIATMNAKQSKYLNTFKTNLLSGIEYYKNLASEFKKEKDQYIYQFKEQLSIQETAITNMLIPSI